MRSKECTFRVAFEKETVGLCNSTSDSSISGIAISKEPGGKRKVKGAAGVGGTETLYRQSGGFHLSG